MTSRSRQLPLIGCCLAFLLCLMTTAKAQDEPAPSTPSVSTQEIPAETPAETPTAPGQETTAETVEERTDSIKKNVDQASQYVEEKTEEIRQQLDSSEEAQKYSAGILQPIYAMAEYMAFSSFYWLAFAIMVSGVVSYILQLVLGKLMVLAYGGFSLAEILSDAQGLVISLVGLVLTTQAATQNSAFTQSAAAVLSSTAVGAVLGLMFYFWGQSAEIQAAKGRRAEIREAKRNT